MARRPLLASTFLAAPAAVTAAQCRYLMGLCAAAALHRQTRRTTSQALDLVVLVPAHDEQLTISAAVRSLVTAVYPDERREVIVIADNCSDGTSRIAEQAGATVWERRDEQRPGKGRALAWALRRIAQERPAADAVVMMDADCVADPDLLRWLAGAIAAGADAAQGAFLGSNPDASPSAALRWAGYALMNSVRPAGRDRLGISCGLFGSGMAFASRTLAEVPWSSYSIAEDKEQHLRLLSAGRRVRYVPEAVVRSPMPTEQAQAETQQARWESGNVQLTRRWVPTLVVRAARERDPRLLLAAWDLLIPPLSLLVAETAALTAVAAGLGAPRAAARSRRSLIVIATYVFGGLAVAGAPWSVFQAMLHAPSLITRRLVQYTAIFRGRGSREWQRTARSDGQ